MKRTTLYCTYTQSRSLVLQIEHSEHYGSAVKFIIALTESIGDGGSVVAASLVTDVG